MDDTFDATREPLRAICDLITFFEAISLADDQQTAVLERAQTAFATLRKMFGDDRPNEVLTSELPREPDIALYSAAPRMLQVLRDTIRCAALPTSWLAPIHDVVTKATLKPAKDGPLTTTATS